MKKIFQVFLVIVFFNSGCIESNSKDDRIISMLKEFYVSYNAVWEDTIPYDSEVFKNNVLSLQQKYCSERLQNEIKKYYDLYKFDHDVLLNDYGTDNETMLNTLEVVKNSEKENSYTVSYIINIGYPSKPRKEKNTIHLTVINQNGIYLIDEIK